MTAPIVAGQVAEWAWIPVVITGTLAQTARNAAQRSVTTSVGTLGATLIRFLYGLPFAALFLVLLLGLAGASLEWPAFGWRYFAWIVTGAASQAIATALLLYTMTLRSFVVGVALSKTEIVQLAVLSGVILGELPSRAVLLAIAVVGAGLVLLAVRDVQSRRHDAAAVWSWRSALIGVGSGGMFALASIAYRAAGLTAVEDTGSSPWIVGAWNVFFAQGGLSVCLVSYLAIRNRAALRAIARAWKVSLGAGLAGAVASLAWSTAYLLRPATDVRTVGMLEVVVSYIVSRRVFREYVGRLELAGLLLVTLGVLIACWP